MVPLFMLYQVALAQKKLITGKVTDSQTGAAMSGVSVLTENKKIGTASKADGTFTLSVDQATTTLILTYIGYSPQLEQLDGITSVNVSMNIVSGADNEVVVVGYGTRKKSSITGAVSKFKNEKLDETPSGRLDQALQGKIAGVRIQNISPVAGADPKVTIRGSTSINAG